VGQAPTFSVGSTPSGLYAYLYGTKNGLGDLNNYSLGVTPSSPTLPAYTANDVAYYTRYAVIRNAQGATVCQTPTLGVNVQPKPQPPVTLQSASVTYQAQGLASVHLTGTFGASGNQVTPLCTGDPTQPQVTIAQQSATDLDILMPASAWDRYCAFQVQAPGMTAGKLAVALKVPALSPNVFSVVDLGAKGQEQLYEVRGLFDSLDFDYTGSNLRYQCLGENETVPSSLAYITRGLVHLAIPRTDGSRNCEIVVYTRDGTRHPQDGYRFTVGSRIPADFIPSISTVTQIADDGAHLQIQLDGTFLSSGNTPQLVCEAWVGGSTLLPVPGTQVLSENGQTIVLSVPEPSTHVGCSVNLHTPSGRVVSEPENDLIELYPASSNPFSTPYGVLNLPGALVPPDGRRPSKTHVWPHSAFAWDESAEYGNNPLVFNVYTTGTQAANVSIVRYNPDTGQQVGSEEAITVGPNEIKTVSLTFQTDAPLYYDFILKSDSDVVAELCSDYVSNFDGYTACVPAPVTY